MASHCHCYMDQSPLRVFLGIFFFARNDCLVSRSGAVNPKKRNYKKLKATKLKPTNYKSNTHNSVTRISFWQKRGAKREANAKTFSLINLISTATVTWTSHQSGICLDFDQKVEQRLQTPSEKTLSC